MEILFLIIYLVVGPFVVKRALAAAERHYLSLAENVGRPQEKMDADDWMGASLFALIALVVTPLVVLWWIVRPPLRLAYRPVRAFLVPPAQKAHEIHVDELDTQLGVVTETAKTYAEIAKWKPDDEQKMQLLQQVREQLHDQLSNLTDLADPDSDFDRRYMEKARQDIEQVRLGRALPRSRMRELNR